MQRANFFGPMPFSLAMASSLWSTNCWLVACCKPCLPSQLKLIIIGHAECRQLGGSRLAASHAAIAGLPWPSLDGAFPTCTRLPRDAGDAQTIGEESEPTRQHRPHREGQRGKTQPMTLSARETGTVRSGALLSRTAISRLSRRRQFPEMLDALGEGIKERRLIGELTQHGQRLRVAKGGKGGKGNESFKTHRNTAPFFCTHGTPGLTGR
eukprot:s4451_g3.t1